MGLEQHTPDATQGAIVAANGYVTVPDDNEELKGSAIASPVEQTLDLMAFLTGGPSNDPDYKITGNGVPPLAGYTPETNPVYIIGTGLRVGGDGARVDTTLALDGATVSGDHSTSGGDTKSGNGAWTAWRVAVLPPTTGQTISIAFDEWRQGGVAGTYTHTVKSSSPTPPEGARIRIWNPGLSTVTVQREDLSEIATFPSGVWGSIDITYWAGEGWRLTMATPNVDLTTATP